MSDLARPSGADLFSESAQKVVDFLAGATPIGDWAVTKVADGEQVQVHVHHDQLLEVGQSNPWQDSFCRRMTLGAAHVVPDSLADPDYADLPHAGLVRAYVGHPITDDDGSTYGMLCGFGTEVLPGVDAIDDTLITLLSELLSTQLAAGRAADQERRSHEIVLSLVQTDALTGLVNRRGWDRLVADAQERVSGFGDTVAVAVIDLDGLKEINDTRGHPAGDSELRRTATALTAVQGPADRIARIGGDEFAILSNDVAPRDLDLHYGRFTASLARAGVEASIGHAVIRPGAAGGAEAIAQADRSMFADKSRRRAQRV